MKQEGVIMQNIHGGVEYVIMLNAPTYKGQPLLQHAEGFMRCYKADELKKTMITEPELTDEDVEIHSQFSEWLEDAKASVFQVREDYLAAYENGRLEIIEVYEQTTLVYRVWFGMNLKDRLAQDAQQFNVFRQIRPVSPVLGL